MTLGFTTTINGEPNFFVEKILASFPESRVKELIPYMKDYYKRFPDAIKGETNFDAKLHTMRSDTHDRWQEGCTIHPVIGNRTPKRFQFAPNMLCVSTQIVRVISNERRVYVLGKNGYRKLTAATIHKLAVNDGFNTVDHFYKYFEGHFLQDLKLIHWTDLKY